MEEFNKQEFPLDKYCDDFVETINSNCGEGEQFRIVINLLANLMSWQGLCFNTDDEETSYYINDECLSKLIRSYKIWQRNENKESE